MNPSLSIVIPIRNEKNYIELIAKQLAAVPLPEKTEILFVEGHSNDGTQDELKRISEEYKNQLNIKCYTQTGIGKADAVWNGLGLAGNDVLMILDADMTVSPEELPKFYEEIKKDGNRFITGSRMVLPMEKGAMRPINYFGNILFAFLMSIILKQKLTDSLCGTKVIYKTHFNKIKERGLISKLNDPFADFTLLLGASDLGLKIIEIPVSYKRRIFDKTKIRRFRDGWQLLKIIFRYLF